MRTHIAQVKALLRGDIAEIEGGFAQILTSDGWLPNRPIAGQGASRVLKNSLSFRDGPSGPGPEPMNTSQAVDVSGRCSWVPGSRTCARAPE